MPCEVMGGGSERERGGRGEEGREKERKKEGDSGESEERHLLLAAFESRVSVTV